MSLTEHEKDLIVNINQQVENLLAKNASSQTIIDTLFDLIPDTYCLMEQLDKDDAVYQKYNYFDYFAQLIRQQ